MKSIIGYILLSVAAVGLGWGGGYLACQHLHKDVQEPFYSGEYDQDLLESMAPALIIDGGYEIDLGQIQPGDHAHEFIIENRGTANLKVSVSDKSTNIETDFGTDEQLIAPGSSLPLGVTLTVAEGEDKSGFVELNTNDGQGTVRLVVSGQ